MKVYTFVKAHQTLHLKWVHFKIWKLFLNKADFSKVLSNYLEGSEGDVLSEIILDDSKSGSNDDKKEIKDSCKSFEHNF